MHHPAKNAIVVSTCALCLTAAYAREQFSSHPIDVTSPEAHYSAGTVVAQPVGVYVAGPPQSPVGGGVVLRELRWDDA